MSTLVTGGAGFIGSHTCVELLEHGYDVVIVDNLSNSRAEVVDAIDRITGKRPAFVRGDLLDAELLERVFCEYDIDSVIHFAGLKAVGESVAKPLSYYRTNIVSTLNLVDAMRRHNCTRIVFSSSATVYAPQDVSPLKETDALGTTNPYGSTKLFIEQILRDVCRADESFTAVLLRYFNPIGAHPAGLIGENPNGVPNNLLPYVTDVALGRLPYLNVFGDDYDTPDGTGVRDYIHVCDLARGHLNALAYSKTLRGADAVNLGTGRGTSVLEIVHAYEEVNHVKIPVRIAPRRPGDNATVFADASRARDVLSWQAQYDIRDMVRDSWNFAKTTLQSET